MKKILLFIISILSFFPLFADIPAYSNALQDNTAQVAAVGNELKIYPNPAETGRVTLEMNSGEISEVHLINIAGKEIFSRKMDFGTSKYVMPLDNVPSGIYFVRVKSVDNKIVIKKLVVSSR